MSNNANVPATDDAVLDPAQSDALLGEAVEQWKLFRAYLTAGVFTAETFSEQVSALGKIDRDAVDAVVANRGVREYAGVRYLAARDEASNYRGDNHQDRIKVAAGHVASVPLERLRDLHRESLVWLKRTAPKDGAVRVARRHDVRREWEATVQWVDDTVLRPYRGDRRDRLRRAIERIDGHLILLEGAKTTVPREYFRLTVAVAAGLLR